MKSSEDMSSLSNDKKISNSVESRLFSQISIWKKLLRQGDLYDFESQVGHCLTELQNQISEQWLKNG